MSNPESANEWAYNAFQGCQEKSKVQCSSCKRRKNAVRFEKKLNLEIFNHEVLVFEIHGVFKQLKKNKTE